MDNKMEQQNKNNISSPFKMLWTDSTIIQQPENTYRYCLNGINSTKDGNKRFISNEESTEVIGTFQVIYGGCYIGNDTILLFCKRSGVFEIGIINKSNLYVPKIETNSLNFDKPIDSTFRVKENKRIVYFVDGENDARKVNVDSLYEHYTPEYREWLNNGSIGIAPTKWLMSSFLLIKTYSKIPEFNNVEILSNGNIIPGSYNFSIRFLDSDLNPTNFITTSNTVNIYNDETTQSYHNIHGSRNTYTDSQKFTAASKSIKLTFDNFDSDYPYYEIAIIQSVSNLGVITKCFLSQPISTKQLDFIYSGNDGQLREIDLAEIKINRPNIKKPDSIEQLENRLILGNTQDVNIDWCSFQQAASLIKTDVVLHASLLNSVQDNSNAKNPNSTFILSGYMPGEVYNFGIVYITDDLVESPVYHILGPQEGDTSTKMKTYTLNVGYSDINNCSAGSYWGVDYNNDEIIGKPVRMNRFPFRSELDLSTSNVVTTIPGTSTIKNYIAKVNITLLSPGTYPQLLGEPKTLNFQVRYKLIDIPSVFTKSLQLTESMLGSDITYYEGFEDIDTTFPVEVIGLPSGLFNITVLPTTVIPIGTIDNATYSNILGIEFQNLHKPANNIIGFYIVRAERTDIDKIVLDNAIIGPNVKNISYKAFSKWNPQIFPSSFDIPSVFPVYTTPFDGTYEQPQFHDEYSCWIFNPEYQFYNKKHSNAVIRVEGRYKPIQVQYPFSPSNLPDDWFTFPGQTAITAYTNYDKYGMWQSDTQAGSKYDDTKPKFATYVPYKITDYRFTNIDGYEPIIGNNLSSKGIIYLSASDYKTDEGSDTFYNTSSDNKIGMIKFINDDGRRLLNFTSLGVLDPRFDINYLSLYFMGPVSYSFLTPPNYFDLLYVSMLSEGVDKYADFLTRTYYKEHNNLILFSDIDKLSGDKKISLFNGDVKVCHFQPQTSSYLKFRRKDDTTNQTWKIVAGVLLLVASIGVTVATFGAGAPLAAAVIGTVATAAVTTAVNLAVSVGLSLVQSGLKYEQMRKMIERDFPNGLLDCVSDVATFAYTLDSNLPNENIEIWYSDIARNLYIETSVNAGLRSKITATGTDFLDTQVGYTSAPIFLTPDYPFNISAAYLREKFTTVDITTGSGRLYRGYPMTEFYDMNLDYQRINKEKMFYCLPQNYDCCDKEPFKFPTRVWYSQQSFQEETIDNYQVILPNSYRDIESEKGAITDLIRYNDNLLISTEEGLWLLPKNLQERVTNQIVSFIGTGEFFSVPPKIIGDDDLGIIGSQSKFATTKAKGQILIINQKERSIYLYDGNLIKISSSEYGNERFFKENLNSTFNDIYLKETGQNYPYNNNTVNKIGIGIISTYDNEYNRFIITKIDYSVNTSFGVVNTLLEVVTEGKVYYVKEDKNFRVKLLTGAIIEVDFDNAIYFTNLSWTISFDLENKAWVSFHSYLPSLMFRNQSTFFSHNKQLATLYIHNKKNEYQILHGSYKPFIIEYVSIQNTIEVNTSEFIKFNVIVRKYDNVQKTFYNIDNTIFTHAVFYNDKQSTGLMNIIVKDNRLPKDRYMQHTLVNLPNTILTTLRENYWSIDDIRDYVINYDVPLFTKDWSTIATQYPIDKVPNPNATSNLKNWYDIQSIRGQYLISRLYFNDNTKTDINIVVLYSINNNTESNR